MPVSTSLVALAVLVTGALAQSTCLINTPNNPPVCENLQITWSGGTPPYFLDILPGNQPNAAPLVQFNQTSGTEITWLVNQAQGTSLGLTLRDNNGVTCQSGTFTVNPGPNSTCVGQPVSASGGSAASTPAGPTSTPAGSTSSPGPSSTSPGGSNSGSSSAGTSKSSSPTSSPSPSPKSGASHNQAAMGIAGVIGAAVLAVLL